MEEGSTQKGDELRLNLQEGGSLGRSMGRAVGMMTTALGAYMTFKMWAEFQNALGIVFGGAWAVIIATMTFLIYQSNKNDKSYESSMGEISSAPNLTKQAMEAENPQPLAFIAGTYLLIIVIFELLLGLVPEI